jgi:hypothetical protein
VNESVSDIKRDEIGERAEVGKNEKEGVIEEIETYVACTASVVASSAGYLRK